MKITTILLCLLTFTSIAYAQDYNDQNHNYLGTSIQVYPAGIIPTINYEQSLNEKSSILYRLGVNIIDRQDFSDENDDETGFGYGGSIGYRLHFPSGNNEFIAGINLDLWNTRIDWQDNLDSVNPTSGTTDTFVVQPWLEGGYFLNFNNNSKLGLTIGLGQEINVITNGDEVGQGLIGTLSVQYYFKI